MKKIEAIIRPEKLEDVKESLGKAGYAGGMTISQVLGNGHQRGFAEYVRGQQVIPTLLAKVKLDIIVRNDQVDELVELICQSVRTGEVGDGKIFVSPIEEAIRIRTGERDADAI